MAEPQRLSIHLPWATLVKVIAAGAAVWLWHELVWVFMLVLIAVIIAVALDPVVRRLEARGVPRWLGSWAIVILILGTLAVFLTITWASLIAQAQHVGQQIGAIQQEAAHRVPKPLLEILRRSSAPDASMIGPYAMAIGRSSLYALAAFIAAWILVAYLLIESDQTYRWVRGFVSERHRRRFDATARDAREAAFGYVVGNFTTSVCAGLYFYVWLAALHVPAALLLALLAFLADFVPVVGFFLSCLPAMAMAATQSATTALMMIPIYMAYHVIENYIIAPRVYGNRLRLSNLAVLIAFAVGAELAGVAGALIALPVAAVYPTIERLWLRDAFGDEVVEEHQAIERSSRSSRSSGSSG
jgi:predicted PurR-regulated permease PerM